MHDDEEDDEGYDEEINNELKKQFIERSKKEFVAGCYDAYELLSTKGEGAIQGASPKEIQRAINRMMALFVIKEEYERCQFLKSFVGKHMPGFEITPDNTVQKELSL
jgi:hypothetical protein